MTKDFFSSHLNYYAYMSTNKLNKYLLQIFKLTVAIDGFLGFLLIRSSMLLVNFFEVPGIIENFV
jgi:hypothetical protein